MFKISISIEDIIVYSSSLMKSYTFGNIFKYTIIFNTKLEVDVKHKFAVLL